MGGPGCCVVPKQSEAQAGSIDFRRLAGCKMRLWNQTRVMAMDAGKEGPCNWQIVPRRGYRRRRQQTRRRRRKQTRGTAKRSPTVKSKQKKETMRTQRRNGASEASDSWVFNVAIRFLTYPLGEKEKHRIISRLSF